MDCAHNQQFDTAQSPGQIMKIIFAIGQETKKILQSKSYIL